LAPSFINVLNVYAFCNLHDVSWGTKGSDRAEALPSVSSKKGKSEEAAVVQDTERIQEDLDAVFEETVKRAVTKPIASEAPDKPSMDDQNRTFRTRLVVFWMLTNAGLAVAIENINGLPNSNASVDEQNLRQKQNIYFAFILFSTFGLSFVRFLGVSCFPYSSFSNLSLLHPVLVVLLQAQSFPVFQEVVKCRVGSPFISSPLIMHMSIHHGLFLISFLSSVISITTAVKGGAKGVYNRCSCQNFWLSIPL